MDGLNQEHIVRITPYDRLRVRVKTYPNSNRPTFAFQLECYFEEIGRWRQVIRADDFDNAPHYDIHHADGTVHKEWCYDYGDNTINMKSAEKFLRENWFKQRERYWNEIYDNSNE